MVRPCVAYAALTLIAALLLVAPTEGYSISGSNLCVSTSSPGSLVASASFASTTNGSLALLGAAADGIIASITSTGTYANDGLSCVANGTARLEAYANLVWAAAGGTVYYKNITAALTGTAPTTGTGTGDLGIYGFQLSSTAATTITQLCRLTNSAYRTSFSQTITFSAFNTATDTGFAAAEMNGAAAIKFAVYNVAWQSVSGNKALTGIADPNYSSATSLITDISIKTSASSTTYRRRLLSVADLYATTVYASTPGASSAISGTSPTGWASAVTSAVSSLGYTGMTANVTTTSGAAALSVSLTTLLAALLTPLLGF